MIPLSLLVGKMTLGLLRLFRRTGSALPGLVVEKLHKRFLPQMLATLPRGVVVVTGTNGKTTTTKLITELLRAEGLRVLTNKTGSNFERGIASVVIDRAHLNGRLDYDIAVLELDEAHAVHFAKRTPPTGLVALNIMRDQMDRFGEIDTTAHLLAKVAEQTTGWLVLNANDPRISKLADDAGSKKVLWFGYDRKLTRSFITDDSYYHGDDTTFFSAALPDIRLVSTINEQGMMQVGVGGSIVDIKTKLEGSHNAINVTAALVALEAVLPDADPDRALEALEAVEPAFGRGEHIKLKNGATVRLQLVKNPGGFSYVLHALKMQPKPDVVGIAINDDYADGRDVSWLWDVQYDSLEGLPPVVCGGTRASDMAVRLKYDGIATGEIEHELSAFLEQCVGQTSEPDQQIVIFTTYTAMLKLRELLTAHSEIKKVGV